MPSTSSTDQTNLDVGTMPARLDAAIEAAIAQRRVVGANVLVSIDGRIVYQRAAGWADREADRAMEKKAAFRLASVSKLFVSTAAMVLVEKGALGLDDRVDRYLPYFRPIGPSGSAPPITIRHLLSHTSGLSYGFLEPVEGPYHQMGVSDGGDLCRMSLRENLERLAKAPLLFEPGAAWNYSLSIDVIGGVIESRLDVPLPDAVRALVSEPLGLTDTDFVATEPTRLATPYVDGSPEPRRMRGAEIVGAFGGMAGLVLDPSRAFDSSTFPSGGAGMVGSAEDTLRLLETLRTGGAPILSQERVDEMARVQTGNLPLANWPGWAHGLGFSVLKDPTAAATPQSLGTWQWGGAYGHSWFVDPKRSLTVVAFTNTALEGMSGGGRFPGDVCEAVYGTGMPRNDV